MAAFYAVLYQRLPRSLGRGFKHVLYRAAPPQCSGKPVSPAFAGRQKLRGSAGSSRFDDHGVDCTHRKCGQVKSTFRFLPASVTDRVIRQSDDIFVNCA